MKYLFVIIFIVLLSGFREISGGWFVNDKKTWMSVNSLEVNKNKPSIILNFGCTNEGQGPTASMYFNFDSSNFSSTDMTLFLNNTIRFKVMKYPHSSSYYPEPVQEIIRALLKSKDDDIAFLTLDGNPMHKYASFPMKSAKVLAHGILTRCGAIHMFE